MFDKTCSDEDLQIRSPELQAGKSVVRYNIADDCGYVSVQRSDSAQHLLKELSALGTRLFQCDLVGWEVSKLIRRSRVRSSNYTSNLGYIWTTNLVTYAKTMYITNIRTA